MTFYTDVKSGNEIEEAMKSGSYLTDGDCLYLPTAWGNRREDKIQLNASVERYTRVTINRRTVLMRDDALEQYRERIRLYDYGILIKVSDGEDRRGLQDAKHESIKVLYQNATKGWKDPFVHGPNER